MNDFTLSGFGTGGAVKKGALSFESETTLSGQVTLTNDAMICAVVDKTGTFSKAIKGTGDLYFGGEGTVERARSTSPISPSSTARSTSSVTMRRSVLSTGWRR